MDILHQILSTYASFFDWDMWVEVLSDPVSWGLIGSLIILEGLLSADNALVLAIMVKDLPKDKQKKHSLTDCLERISSAFYLSDLGYI